PDLARTLQPPSELILKNEGPGDGRTQTGLDPLRPRLHLRDLYCLERGWHRHRSSQWLRSHGFLAHTERPVASTIHFVRTPPRTTLRQDSRPWLREHPIDWPVWCND